ncbi:MAG: hypothetical protein PHU85_09855 [Phycisphaerae bacterium]|nr:hypothetical protein [Phycisphaerae bacterium]
MTIDEFCSRIAGIGLGNAQKALAILWFLELEEVENRRSAGELAAIIRSHRLGNPNATQLARQIRSIRYTLATKGKFQIRQDKKAEVRSWVEPVLSGITEEVPAEAEFLDRQVWKPTRGYIEKVCDQLNGAYHRGFYDCAAVMVRRVIETLIIEAYEALKRQSEIKDADGNYFMLGILVEQASGTSGLTIGREAKKGLAEIKKLGDRSAHNRRYNAKKGDLDHVRDLLRLCFEELANIAQLYRRE